MAAEEIVEVDVRKIVREPALQVRARVDMPWVHQIRQAYRSGRTIDPVTVAEIDGRPYLIDGWHRLRALELLREETAPARIIRGLSLQEARWRAAAANLSHGQPLKPRERLKVFKAFIGARRHRCKDAFGRDDLMSYRQIAPYIGVDHTTIRRWMMDHFPQIAAEMAGEDPAPYQGQFEKVRIGANERQVREALDKAVETFKRIRSEEVRERLADEAKRALQVILQADAYEAPNFDDGAF